MKKYYCPIFDNECPYCIGLDYECVIGNPKEECSDYYDEEEEDEDES